MRRSIAIDSMADASNDRKSQLDALMNQALPAANRQLDIQKMQLVIARWQKDIIKADAALVRDLISFQDRRFLNKEFWAKLAAIMKRIMSRYLDLGTRMAWLAERALEYEQNRTMDIIRLDYFPNKTQGVLGADMLQLDLAELDAARLDGIKKTIPIKHTYSLMRDFPLQYGQLKQTNQCVFRTTELPFQSAYPGTYSHRLKNVTVQISSIDSPRPIRGILQNQGISILSSLGENGQEVRNVSIGSPEALPLSEFRMKDDMLVYGLPDEALSPFEGVGVETFWSIQLPVEANPFGFDDLLDILITFDVRALYSAELHRKHAGSGLNKENRFMMLSAQKFVPEAMKKLQSNVAVDEKVEIVFDLAKAGLVGSKTKGTVSNLLLLLPSALPTSFAAVLSCDTPPKSVSFSFTNNVVASTMPPVNEEFGQEPPLNQFIGVDAYQKFKLIFDKSLASSIDFTSITDVIFGIEYSVKV